jgi:hypothetical protein
MSMFAAERDKTRCCRWSDFSRGKRVSKRVRVSGKACEMWKNWQQVTKCVCVCIGWGIRGVRIDDLVYSIHFLHS